jgi:hypothetical protein
MDAQITSRCTGSHVSGHSSPQLIRRDSVDAVRAPGHGQAATDHHRAGIATNEWAITEWGLRTAGESHARHRGEYLVDVVTYEMAGYPTRPEVTHACVGR